MKKIRNLASASILALALSVTAFAGDISGGRTSDISGGASGFITNRVGDISGGRTGDISGGLVTLIMTVISGLGR